MYPMITVCMCVSSIMHSLEKLPFKWNHLKYLRIYIYIIVHFLSLFFKVEVIQKMQGHHIL